MKACPDETTWARYLDDGVDEGEAETLETHLDDCEPCRSRLVELADRPTAEGPAARPLRASLPVIPGHELIAEIGRGGMGIVYRAWRGGHDRPVAVKLVHALEGANPETRARAAREAKALARLDHPNIVRILDAGDVEGSPFLVMEWFEEGDLAARLRAGPLPPRDAARLGLALARAIAAAHAAGILHRDIKPSNVLIGGDGAPRLADFGLAREIDAAALTSPGTAPGTPAYMAPEQVDHHLGPVGPGVDVYGLGATLYGMLTGLPPFRGVNAVQVLRQVTGREPVAPRLIDASIPRELEAICLRCLAKRPGLRYASAADLADDLERYLDGRRVVAAGRPWARALGASRRHPARTAAVLLAVAVVGLVLATSEYRRRRAVLREASSGRLLRAAIGRIEDLLTRTRRAEITGEASVRPFRLLATRQIEPFFTSYLAERDPAAPWSADEVRMLYDLSGQWSREGRGDEAQALLRRCAELGHPLLETNPGETELAATLTDVENWLATLADRLGGLPAAIPHSEAAYRVARTFRVPDLADPGIFYLRVVAQTNLTSNYASLGRHEDALRVEREGLDFARAALAARPDDATVAMQLVSHLHRLARFQLALGRQDELAGWLDEADSRLARLQEAGASSSFHDLPGLLSEGKALRSQLLELTRNP